MKRRSLLFLLLGALLLACPLLARAQDSDADGLPDAVETNTGLFLGPLNTGTDPFDADTDGDGVIDGLEVLLGANPLNPVITPGLLGKLGLDLQVTQDPINSYNHSPSLTWIGSEFGVSWYGNEIFFARISSAGTKIAPDLNLSQSDCYPGKSSLTWTGSEFGVVWDQCGSGISDLLFARISSTGANIGPAVRVAQEPASLPSLVWTGSEFGVSWWGFVDENLGIVFARFSSSGAKIGANLRVTQSSVYFIGSSLTWAGSEFGVSWNEDRDGNYEIYFARISSAGAKIGPDLRITNDPNESVGPSLTWTGSEFGISWSDNRDGNNEIYFARISSDGTKLGPDFRVTQDPGYSESPSLIWTGWEFGVSWHDYRDEDTTGIYFIRISSAGANLGTDLRVFQTFFGSYTPSLIWSGSEFGVSWMSYKDIDGNSDIYFVRIGFQDGDGDWLSSEYEISAGTNPADWDTDDDGLSDGGENTFMTNPLAADSDHDGINDGPEVFTYGTNPISWDTDGDALPDGYEAAKAGESPPLDALNALDGGVSFDADTNLNVHEYWNGSDPWAANPVGGVGCFYWADAGLGDGIVSPTDAIELKKALSGGVGNYTGVIPNSGETHELDMDGYISPLDLIILQKMIVQTAIPILGSRPASLEVLESPPPTVAVGLTCHVAVGVKNEAGLYTPGIGVVFEIDALQSTGSATLLGGDGVDRGAADPSRTRYDISGPIASSGRSRIVLRMDSAGTITIQAGIPACGAPGIGRSCNAITLSPAAIIHAQ